jgi:hypothetical protein
MGAYPDQHSVFRLKQAVPVNGIWRLLDFAELRIDQLGQQFGILKGLKQRRRAIGHKNRSATPDDHDLLSGLDPAQIKIDWAASREGCGIWVHLTNQRNQGRQRAHRARGGCCNKEKIAKSIEAVM